MWANLKWIEWILEEGDFVLIGQGHVFHSEYIQNPYFQNWAILKQKWNDDGGGVCCCWWWRWWWWWWWWRWCLVLGRLLNGTSLFFLCRCTYPPLLSFSLLALSFVFCILYFVFRLSKSLHMLFWTPASQNSFWNRSTTSGSISPGFVFKDEQINCCLQKFFPGVFIFIVFWDISLILAWCMHSHSFVYLGVCNKCNKFRLYCHFHLLLVQLVHIWWTRWKQDKFFHWIWKFAA